MSSVKHGCGAAGPHGLRCNSPHTPTGWHVAVGDNGSTAWKPTGREVAASAPMHDETPAAATTNIHNGGGRSDAFEATAIEVLAEIAFQLKRVADALEQRETHVTNNVGPGLTTAQVRSIAEDVVRFAAHRSNP